MRYSITARLFLFLIGAFLILYNAGTPLLKFIGSRDTVVVTSIRRQGGERRNNKGRCYTYSIGYVFTITNGREINESVTSMRG